MYFSAQPEMRSKFLLSTYALIWYFGNNVHFTLIENISLNASGRISEDDVTQISTGGKRGRNRLGNTGSLRTIPHCKLDEIYENPFLASRDN